MDPSIMKLLEEDEDESMHSGADVEAFTAALNRDIGGDASSISQPSDTETVGLLLQEGSSISKQSTGHWQDSSQQKDLAQQVEQQQERQHLQLEQAHKDQQQQAETDALQLAEIDQISEPNPLHRPEHERPHHSESQQQQMTRQLNNQLAPTLDQSNNQMKRMKFVSSISFNMLIPILRPHLDKDRCMQLASVYQKLRNNEISKEDFLRVIRNIVGDQMLRQAAHKVQMQMAARKSQTSSSQLPLPAPPQQHPSHTAQQFVGGPSFPQLHSVPSIEHQKGVQKLNELENKSDGQGLHPVPNMNMVKQERDTSVVSIQTVNKQQQHSQHPSTTFSMYGATPSNYSTHAFPRSPVSGPATSLKSQAQDSQIKQLTLTQGMVSTQIGATQPTNVMNASKYEMQNTVTETKRLQGGPPSQFTTHPPLQQSQMTWQALNNKEQKTDSLTLTSYVKQEVVEQTVEPQNKPQFSAPQVSSFSMVRIEQGTSTPGSSKDEMRTQIPSTTPPVAAGTSAKTPQKKPSVGQKKPLETLGTPSPVASKKQKVSGAFLDQSIEQLNDVTAVSGVNLREEEEQLLSAPKEESRASEATRRVVQEEEERLILQRGPLQKKLVEIMSRCGIKNISSDVERCLSMCVEERLRGLISNLIRLSKQRVDVEKPRHRIVFTSDVQRQILAINRKAKEELDKKQAEEAEKLRKLNEGEGTTGADTEKEKEEGRSKAVKPNKEEDDKMRTTAANVAARAAVGGDDMLSKWQLMAEQARQKREGGLDTTSASTSGRVGSHKPLSNFGRTLADVQEADKKGPSTASASGAIRRFGRSPGIMPQPKIVRSICTKDVIAVLEREPQMSKSSLIYHLHGRMSGNTPAE